MMAHLKETRLLFSGEETWQAEQSMSPSTDDRWTVGGEFAFCSGAIWDHSSSLEPTNDSGAVPKMLGL